LGRGEKGSSEAGDEDESRLALLTLVRRVTRYVSCSVTGTVLIPGNRLDRRRLADATAFSYDAEDVLPLAGGV